MKQTTSAKKLAKAARQQQPSTLRFELKPPNGTITEGGKACSTGGIGTVLCDRPIQRNTGLHEAEFKQTSNEYVSFGMASATIDLENRLGNQKGSAGLFTGGSFFTDGKSQGNVTGRFGDQEPVTLAVDTDVAGALECVWSVGGREKKRHPIEEGWRFAVGCSTYDGASFEIVRYTVTARATDVRRAPGRASRAAHTHPGRTP